MRAHTDRNIPAASCGFGGDAHGLRKTFFAACSLLCAWFLWGCQPETLPNYPPAYREYAYITNGKSNDVSVIDLLAFKEVKSIPVGAGPTGVVANPKKNEVYVVNSDAGTLSVIDAEQNSVAAIIGLHKRPYFVDLTPDGGRAVVANAGSANVSVIDLNQRKEIAAIAVGDQPGLARVSPDGKLAVVTNRNDATVSVIDLSTLRVRSTVHVCKTPEEIAFVLNSSKAFITCSSVNQVAVVALKAEAVPPAAAPTVPQKPNSKGRSKAKGLPLPQAGDGTSPDRLIAILDVGATPLHIAVKPDGGEVFISNFGSDSVSELITDTDEISSTHLVGAEPVRSIVSPDNSLLYVSSFGSNQIAVYGIDDGRLVQTIPVGARPDALVFTPNGHYLLVVDSGSGDVAVIRRDSQLNANLLFTMVPTGLEPRQIAVKNFMLRKPPPKP